MLRLNANWWKTVPKWFIQLLSIVLLRHSITPSIRYPGFKPFFIFFFSLFIVGFLPFASSKSPTTSTSPTPSRSAPSSNSPSSTKFPHLSAKDVFALLKCFFFHWRVESWTCESLDYDRVRVTTTTHLEERTIEDIKIEGNDNDVTINDDNITINVYNITINGDILVQIFSILL